MTAATNTSGSAPLRVTSRSPGETERLAARLGRLLAGGEALALVGPLGAGKTLFAKGVGRGLGIAGRDVTSPTFLLIHELSGRLPLRHIDAYRIAGSEELVELGALEVLSGSAIAGDPVVLVEWADRVADLLPADRIEVTLAHGAGGTTREVTIRATGPRHASLVEALDREDGS